MSLYLNLTKREVERDGKERIKSFVLKETNSFEITGSLEYYLQSNMNLILLLKGAGLIL